MLSDREEVKKYRSGGGWYKISRQFLKILGQVCVLKGFDHLDCISRPLYSFTVYSFCTAILRSTLPIKLLFLAVPGLKPKKRVLSNWAGLT